ncbi:MAG: tetratricopeptide repeat protein [Elusimicrobiota bacterium]
MNKDKGSGNWFLRVSVIAPLAIALVTFLVFSGVLRNEFVNWDDDLNFLNNFHYRGLGPAQIHWMFTNLLGHYIPLTWLTLGLDYVLWGMNPAGYHLTNLLLHCANAMVFYFVGRRLLVLALSADAEPNRGWLALTAGFSALLFALHPLRVESVAWATERRDVLVGLFYLLTVLFYLKAAACAEKARKARLFSISVLFFAMSLLSKVSGSTLPLALLALDIYPLRRLPGDPRRWFSADLRRVWLEKIPFILLAIPACLLAVKAQHQIGALLSLGKLSVAERLAQAMFGLAFYIHKTLLPLGLSPYYPLPDKINPFAAPFLLSGLAVVLITAGAFALRRKWPAVLAVWACYAITLLPVLGFTQSGTHIAADRFTYIASFGLTLLAAWVAVWFLKEKCRLSLKMAAVIMCVPLAVLSYFTWLQVKVWRDSESVWRQALAINPSIAVAHNNLGMALNAHGHREEAMQHYNLALRVKPDYALAHNNLANALAAQGNTEEAIRHYDLALKAKPNYADAHYNLALALTRQGKMDAAILHYNLTLQAQPEYALAHNNLANALAAQGKYDDAILQYNLALEDRPDLAEAHYNLANALSAQGKLDEAARHYRLTIQARPNLALAYNNLANVLTRQGKLDEAVLYYQQALKLNPGFEQPRRNLEIIFNRKAGSVKRK